MRLKFNFRDGLHFAKPEKRFFDWQNYVPTRPTGYSSAGIYVDRTTAMGLATANACVRVVSETIGMMPLKVYEGERPEVEEARDSWQWFRLKEQPNAEQSAYDFWQDAAMSIETTGNAFIWKALSRRPVQNEGDIQLYLIDPNDVQIRRDENNRKFYMIRRNNKQERVPVSRILQIRGWTTSPGADMGVSPITLHQETLGSAVAARQFQMNTYTSGGGNIPGVIQVPGTPTQESLDRYQLELEQRHAGTSRPLVLTGGASWQTTGISLKDAEYIAQQEFSSEEVCRIFRVNPRMVGLELDSQKAWEQDMDEFLQADMAPRLRRIEMALKRDTDLFPSTSELFPEFLTSAVLKPSITTRYAAYKSARQGGWLMANEIRELENYAPAEGGDELQATPVGGAPNEPGVTEAEQ
jgi:HK97 family phage portal protein